MLKCRHDVFTKLFGFHAIVTSTCAAEVMRYKNCPYVLGNPYSSRVRKAENSSSIQITGLCCARGGIMIGDDFAQDWPGVMTAVNKFACIHMIEAHLENE